MSSVSKVAARLRDAQLGGNSTDPSFYDEKAEILELIAADEPNLASAARTFAATARARATDIRSRRGWRR